MLLLQPSTVHREHRWRTPAREAPSAGGRCRRCHSSTDTDAATKAGWPPSPPSAATAGGSQQEESTCAALSLPAFQNGGDGKRPHSWPTRCRGPHVTVPLPNRWKVLVPGGRRLVGLDVPEQTHRAAPDDPSHTHEQNKEDNHADLVPLGAHPGLQRPVPAPGGCGSGLCALLLQLVLRQRLGAQNKGGRVAQLTDTAP